MGLGGYINRSYRRNELTRILGTVDGRRTVDERADGRTDERGRFERGAHAGSIFYARGNSADGRVSAQKYWFDRRLARAYESIFSTVSMDDPLPSGYPTARTLGDLKMATIGTGLVDHAEQAGQDGDPVTAAVLRHIAAHDAARAAPEP